jgi:hypothetical protein
MRVSDILVGLPIKDWVPQKGKPDDETIAEMKVMEDYLFNDDLATELNAGGKETVSEICPDLYVIAMFDGVAGCS